MTIAQLNPLRVETFVPSALFGHIRMNGLAEVRPQEPVGARLIVVDRVLDAASGTFGVRLELSDEDLSLPGGLRCRIGLLAKGVAPASQ